MVDKVGFRFDVGIYFSRVKSGSYGAAACRPCACGSVFAACGWRESVGKHRQTHCLSPKRRRRHKEEPHIWPFGSQCVHPRFRRFGRGGRPYSSGGRCHRQQYGALSGADAAAGAPVHRLRGGCRYRSHIQGSGGRYVVYFGDTAAALHLSDRACTSACLPCLGSYLLYAYRLYFRCFFG